MDLRPSPSRMSRFALPMLPLILGCAGEAGRADIGDVDEVQSAIRNGTVVNPWAPNAQPTFAQAVVKLDRGCTGTVVKPSWVLSARHCDHATGETVTSVRPTGDITRTIDAVLRHPDPARDTEMLHLSSPFTDIPQVNIYSGTTESLTGQTVRCIGYGAKAVGSACTDGSQCSAGQYCSGKLQYCLTPSNELRYAEFPVASYNHNVFQTSINVAGQTPLEGDSGGPCQVGGAHAGVMSVGGIDHEFQASTSASFDLVKSPSQIMYTTGDFNDDGKTDFLITKKDGSYWYYSTPTGDWELKYSRPELVIGRVKYVPGDFDGDHKTDLIITTWDGSYWYRSTGSGWEQTHSNDLKAHNVDYATGDFNNDGKTDVIEKSETGTNWYFSTGTGIGDLKFSRPDLQPFNSRYITGDFNGDNKTDMIVQTPTGSYWYFSKGDGHWDVPYSRTDLPLGSAEYVTGDFDGNNKTDMIVQKTDGSYWYFSKGDGQWDVLFSRTDLPLNTARYTPGDFDGDGKTDLIITTSGGSYWYYSLGDGHWDVRLGRTDLDLFNVRYETGNFNGDSRTDAIIFNTSGSYWYYSTSTRGSFTEGYRRTDWQM
jgi:hypothetical protein